MDELPIGYCLLDTDGFIRYANVALSRMLGLESNALADQSLLRFVHDTDAVTLTDFIKKRPRIGQTPQCSLELRLTKSDGTNVSARLDLNVSKRAGPDSLLHVTILDQTEEKELEGALIRRNQLLERTGAIAKVGGWELDLRTMTRSWSAETCRILDIDPPVTPSEDQTRIFGFYPPESRPVIEVAVAEAIECGKPFDLELPMITATGRRIWVRDECSVELENGKAIRLFGAIQDITAGKEIEAALRESEDRWKFAIEGSGDGLWDWNIETGAAYVNQRWKEMFGFEDSQPTTILQKWRERTHPDDLEQMIRMLQAHLDGETPHYSSEYRVETSDGQWRWILGRGVVVTRDESGKALRMIGTHSDITQRRSEEAALQVARQQAELANHAKSEFLANMSHEIRTPLTAILGFAELLRDAETDKCNAHRQNAIDTISNAGMHLLTVINDILDLSKIEADKTIIERLETPLPNILREVDRLLRPRAAGKGISLNVIFDTPIPDRIWSDPTRLRQILMNLTGNAIKFTETGGVTIRGQVIESETESQLILDIEDTGPGLTPEQADKLFQSFSQVDSSVARIHGGTGLGLVISKRLAKLMGGDVVLFRSQPGEGACFRLRLPLSPTPNSRLTEQISESTISNAPISVSSIQLQGKILLAEDGVDNQRLISFLLRKAGATVDVANNGKIALAMIEREKTLGAPYDLLVTDIQMPEMDGYQLARTLRERSDAIAIVALTANALSEDRAKCLDAGCDDYASKPIEKNLLLSVCAKWLRNAQN